MHAYTNELLAHLDTGRAELLRAVAAVAEHDRGRAPVGRWSVANVLAHLARTEGQIAALLQRSLRRQLAEQALPKAPSAPAGTLVARFDGAPVVDRTERLAAPEFAEPDPSLSAADAARDLERARSRLRAVLLAADGYDASRIRQPHHVFGELDFYQWVLFAGFHERRHTAQVRELVALLDR